MTRHKFENGASFLMSGAYFIHVMGKRRPRHVLRHWSLQNFQGFVRPSPFYFLITFPFTICSQALHDNEIFSTKHVDGILVVFWDLKILKFPVNRRDVNYENISFLKFVFTLWVWSFVLGLSCGTGQSFRAASCGASPKPIHASHGSRPKI